MKTGNGIKSWADFAEPLFDSHLREVLGNWQVHLAALLATLSSRVTY